MFYNNVITKKNAFGDQNLFIFPAKTHVGEKIEIITGIVINTLQSFGYHYYDWVAFKTNSFCIYWIKFNLLS